MHGDTIAGMIDLFDRLRPQLEDFWSRRETALDHARSFEINGCRVRIMTNRAEALAAADHAIPQYSRASLLQPDRELLVRLVFSASAAQPSEAPADLLPRMRYTASGDWFHLDLDGWGHCAADLGAGLASAVLAPALAGRPETVARALLHTLFTNYFFRSGFAMLHATGLVHDGRLLLLMAPHNTGKSTTALRLTFSGGFRLLTDSMVFVAQTDRGPQLTGFPIGRGKLRADMVGEFPALAGLLQAEQVRSETKFVLDLRRIDPGLVLDEAFYPQEIVWCLLSRRSGPDTLVRPAALDEARETILLNSLHYDEREVWEGNLDRIEPLARMARFHRVEMGTDPERLTQTIRALMAG